MEFCYQFNVLISEIFLLDYLSVLNINYCTILVLGTVLI